MGRDRLEKNLARLHQGAVDPSGHELALRAELVARFRRQFPVSSQSPLTERSTTMKNHSRFRRLAIAGVLLIGLGAASRAPAEYPVEVGKRIEISVQNPGADWPRPPQLEPVLAQLGHNSQVQLRARRTGDGALTLTIELWGDGIAANAPEQLRAAFPAMKEAQITVSSIEAQARGHLSDKIEAQLFNHQDPAATEAARLELQARLLAELKAQGKDGTVDVQVDSADGKQRVTVKVEAQGEAPATTEDLKP